VPALRRAICLPSASDLPAPLRAIFPGRGERSAARLLATCIDRLLRDQQAGALRMSARHSWYLRRAVQPVLFTLPGIDWEVQSYGFFVGLALVLGWVLALSLARRDGLPADRLGAAYVVSAAFALFSARAVWVMQHPDAYEGWRSLFTLQAGTLAPFAGVLFGLVLSGVMVSRRGVNAWAWYDVLAPAFALAVVLESLGALFAGTAFGTYARDAPFTLTFPEGSPAFIEHSVALRNLMTSGATESLPVHPVQIYSALAGVAGLALCWWLRKRRQFVGQIFCAFVIWFLAFRSFVEEFLRADAATPVAGPLNGGQMGALVMIAALGVVYWVRARAASRPVVAPSVPAPAGPERAAKPSTSTSKRKAKGKGKGKGGSRRGAST
jgi:prolipoprotein diacylglyceryltransferase